MWTFKGEPLYVFAVLSLHEQIRQNPHSNVADAELHILLQERSGVDVSVCFVFGVTPQRRAEVAGPQTAGGWVSQAEVTDGVKCFGLERNAAFLQCAL
jgi:hypothetical protein